MPSDFTVDWASPPGDPYGQANDNVAYWIKLKEDTQNRSIMLGQKLKKPAPSPGQQLFGDITEQQKKSGEGTYWKFIKADRQDAPRNNGGGQQHGASEDSGRQVSIVRQHSQHMAVRLVEMAVGSGVVPKPENGSDLFELVKRTTDWFDRDVEQAVANHALSADDAQRRSEDGF